MSNGSINFKRFKALFPLLIFRPEFCRTHIMKPVGKLDNNNTHVLIHSYKHFSDVFSLNLFPCGKRDFTEFCNAVNKQFNVGTELLFYIIKRIFRIFNNIVKQSAYNTLVIHSEFKQNFSHCNRVHNIRLARAPFLVFMRLFCKFIRFFYFFVIILWVLFYLFKKIIKPVVIFTQCQAVLSNFS